MAWLANEYAALLTWREAAKTAPPSVTGDSSVVPTRMRMRHSVAMVESSQSDSATKSTVSKSVWPAGTVMAAEVTGDQPVAAGCTQGSDDPTTLTYSCAPAVRTVTAATEPGSASTERAMTRPSARVSTRLRHTRLT